MNVIHTSKAPAAIGPYEQAYRHGEFIFTSGQIGADPAAGYRCSNSGGKLHSLPPLLHYGVYTVASSDCSSFVGEASFSMVTLPSRR